MKPPILLFGATSILGFTLARLFPQAIRPYISPSHSSREVQDWPVLHLENSDWIEATFSRFKPNILLYCHAVCDVPKCEADPDWAYEINVGHVHRMLKALPSYTRLIYVSSDHVFGGDGTYDERATPCPISVYGRTRVEAEQLVFRRPLSLVIRVGLAIGVSPDGRTGHLDWLRYRRQHNLPITIVEDEYRSAVWAKDLALRVMQVTRSHEEGLRHISSTQTVSRVALAQFLLEKLGENSNFQRESRRQRLTPHLGRVELVSLYPGPLTQPLPTILETKGP